MKHLSRKSISFTPAQTSIPLGMLFLPVYLSDTQPDSRAFQIGNVSRCKLHCLLATHFLSCSLKFYQSINLFLFLHRSIYLFPYLSVCLPVCLFIYLFIYLYYQSIHHFIHLSICII